MSYYRCTGSIFIEGTMEQADYDVEIDENDIEDADDPIEILKYLLNSGVLQIMHEDTEYFEDEDA